MCNDFRYFLSLFFSDVVQLIEGEELDYLKLLLSVRPDILTMHGGEWGGTPTIIAAQYNKLEILKYLLTLVQVSNFLLFFGFTMGQ